MISNTSEMDRRAAPRKRLTGRLLFLLAVALACAIAAAFTYPSLRRWASAERAVTASALRIGEVISGDLVRELAVQGKVVAAEAPTLVSPALGVVSVLAKAGDVVSQGRPLARIESPGLRNLLEQERSTLRSMQVELDRQRIAARQRHAENQQHIELLAVRDRANQRSAERAQALFDEKLASSIDLEKALDEVEVVQLEIRNQRSKIQLDQQSAAFDLENREHLIQRQELVVRDLERKIQQLAVVSPVGGLVAKVEVRDKDTVQPNQALFSVVDLSKFQVQIAFPENYSDEVFPGTSIVVVVNGIDYVAEIKYLSPEVEGNQVAAFAAFTDSVPSGLKQNQRLSARLILESRSDVLKVPRGAFIDSLGGRQAYVVENGVAYLRPIQTGVQSVTEVEIVSGLEKGQSIILSDMSRFQGAKSLLLAN
jgi:HlyD family secretion protein